MRGRKWRVAGPEGAIWPLGIVPGSDERSLRSGMNNE